MSHVRSLEKGLAMLVVLMLVPAAAAARGAGGLLLVKCQQVSFPNICLSFLLQH